MEWAIEQAKASGFARLSANVWADNVAARALFESQGFAVRTRVEVPPHPACPARPGEPWGFAHVGGSLLMVR
jgi:hypothetical protein